jgi:hypothetical protein
VSEAASDPHLTAAERAQLLAWLDDSRREFLAAIDAVSEDQWTRQPAPDRWSVGGNAEHIVLGEALLFSLVRRALRTAPDPDWHARTAGKADLIARVMPETGKAIAPEVLVPHMRLTRADAHERFERQRIDIERFARETQDALKAHTSEHPMKFFGTLNAHQWLIYVPLHTIRHARQIETIKRTASGLAG